MKKFTINVEEFYAQFDKNKEIRKHIAELEKSGKDSSLLISAFLLKSQLIEFELWKLIQTLDYCIIINLSSSHSIVTRIERTSDYFRDKTLGHLVTLVKEFEGLVSDEFKDDLTHLNGLRNDFIHHSFSSKKTISDLREDAGEGLKVGDKILDEIYSIVDEIMSSDKDINDPIRQNLNWGGGTGRDAKSL